MLGTKISKQVIDGVLKLVQTVTYSDGKTVRRVLCPQTMVPQEILEEPKQLAPEFYEFEEPDFEWLNDVAQGR
jgi:predicted DNA-binding antitoxin AbrB/MazE fold protein